MIFPLPSIVRLFPNYRKRFIAHIPTLQYLDDRPVFEGERRLSEAWAREGRQGEENERTALARERRADQLRVYRDTESRVLEAERKREAYLQHAREQFEQTKRALESEMAAAQSVGDRAK